MSEKDPTPNDSIVDLKYSIPVSAEFLWNKKFRLVKSLTEGLGGRTIQYEIGNDCKSDDTSLLVERLFMTTMIGNVGILR